MSDRPGNWQLLNQPKDPIGGDAAAVAQLVAYYTAMAETIKTEAATLQQIGDGDDSQFKGEAADALRKRSRDVAYSLNQASGRYAAAGQALKAFQPELVEATTQSALALTEAEAAQQARTASAGLPDPSANRAADAPPLTTEETADVAKRAAAIDGAEAAAAAAQKRLDDALSALNSAGQRAKNAITAAWKDGLTDTRAYKIRQGFINFLKTLVKVFMWLGIALAAIGLLIPGLGLVSLLGLIVTATSFVASTFLAAFGEGSWLDVILGAVSLLLIGAGMIIAKVVQNTHIDLLTKAGQKSTTQRLANTWTKLSDHKITGQAAVNKIAKLEQKFATTHAATIAKNRADIMTDLFDGKITAQQAIDKLANVEKDLMKSIDGALDTFKVKPQFWNITQPGYIAGDIGKLKDILAGKYRLDRLFSVDRALNYKDLQAAAGLASHSVISKIQPWWHYGNGGRVVLSGGINIHKVIAAVPGPYKDTIDDAKSHLMTPKIS